MAHAAVALTSPTTTMASRPARPGTPASYAIIVRPVCSAWVPLPTSRWWAAPAGAGPERTRRTYWRRNAARYARCEACTSLHARGRDNNGATFMKFGRAAAIRWMRLGLKRSCLSEHLARKLIGSVHRIGPHFKVHRNGHELYLGGALSA